MITIQIAKQPDGNWTWTLVSEDPPIDRIGIAGDVEGMAERIYETLTQEYDL